MLVLSRKQSQQITLGESITITVLSVQGGRVRLGIDAPASVRVLRAELGLRLSDVGNLPADEEMRQDSHTIATRVLAMLK